jgi:hypothetical protein
VDDNPLNQFTLIGGIEMVKAPYKTMKGGKL